MTTKHRWTWWNKQPSAVARQTMEKMAPRIGNFLDIPEAAIDNVLPSNICNCRLP